MRFFKIIIFFFLAPVIAGSLSYGLSAYEELLRDILGFQPSTTPGGSPTGLGGFLVLFVPILFLHILFLGLKRVLRGNFQSRVRQHLLIFLCSAILNVVVGYLLFKPGVDQFHTATFAATFLFCLPLFIGEALAFEIQLFADKRS